MKEDKSIANLREDYRAKTLDITDVLANPIQQFKNWLQEALQANIKEANAMTLATCVHQRPTARIVLLKGIDQKGFYFYTNYESKKGIQIDDNPNVALVFLWKELERQVRIEGIAKKSSRQQSLSYFQSRPKGSQIGAWCSPQSTIIPNRAVLTDKYKALEKVYEDQEELPLPTNWGGYCVQPTYFEFWQGRSSRLHDRISYSLSEEKHWILNRLAP